MSKRFSNLSTTSDDGQAAICVLRNAKDTRKGIARITQLKDNTLRFRVYASGLRPGLHGIHIHQSTNDCDSCVSAKQSCCNKTPNPLCLKGHLDPTGKMNHGDRNDPKAHLGDLGNVRANEKGIVKTSFVAKRVRLTGKNSIVGRSLVIHADRDDLGKGTFPDSKITGHSGKRVLWGVIGYD